VKGGNLAAPVQEVVDLFNEVNPGASPSSWAVRFCASLEGVLVVLSGMSNVDQMADNLTHMSAFKPLNENEMQAIDSAREIIGSIETIPCTSCEYCIKGCPQNIAIPGSFNAYNMFRRFNNMRAAHHPFRVLLIVPIALAFCSAFFVSLTADFEQALTIFMAVIALGVPTTACIGYFLPLSHANQLLTHHNAALIGNEAVEEYSESKTVIFNDARLCTAQSCTELSVRQSDDLRKDLKLAGILFRKIGGTLERIGQATATKTPDPTVAFVRIADTGVEAVIDNQHHVIAGDAEFLKRCGVRISREAAERALNHPANVGVLFVAIDGIPKLSYEIEYALNPRFEELAERLADPDTSIAIQSYDPSLNEGFLQNLRLSDAVPIRVIKPGKYESNAMLEISDSGAVSLSGEERIAHPLYAAKKAHSATRFSFIFQLIATMVGFVGATVLACALHVTLSPLVIGAYHLICILISTIVTHANINKRTLYLQRQ